MPSTDFPLRDIITCDFKRLKKAHASLLPIPYENDFFIKVCGKELAHFGLCAEGDDPATLAGFATARQVGIEALCPNDRRALNASGIAVDDKSELVYVLTIGVSSRYRRRGLAHSLMQGIVREALHRNCAVVLLHTPTNNSAACGLYRKLGFLHLRKHLSFYSLPAASTEASPSKRLLPVHLDAYLFGRSTQIPFRNPCRDTSTEEGGMSHTTQPAEHQPTPPAGPSGPSPQSMIQSRDDADALGAMLHEQHEYEPAPALPTSQAALLADVGFSGALVRSTEAAGVAFGIMSSWFRSSCTAQVPYGVPTSSTSRLRSSSASSRHSGLQRQAQSCNSATTQGRTSGYGPGIELPVLGGSADVDQDDDYGTNAILSDCARDAAHGSATADDLSSGTTGSDCSTERWLQGQNMPVFCQSGLNGGGLGPQSAGRSLLQPQTAAPAADLTFFQRLFGRP